EEGDGAGEMLLRARPADYVVDLLEEGERALELNARGGVAGLLQQDETDAPARLRFRRDVARLLRRGERRLESGPRRLHLVALVQCERVAQRVLNVLLRAGQYRAGDREADEQVAHRRS